MIYFNNLVIGEISDLPTLESKHDDKLDAAIYALKSIDKPATFSIHITPQDVIGLICGKRITNNYLKLHGGIMRRKYRK